MSEPIAIIDDEMTAFLERVDARRMLEGDFDLIKAMAESPGSLCPRCLKGRLYRAEPGVLLRFVGTAPIQGTLYELEKYRCNLCGEILKYGNGLSFYRLEQLQRSYGVPLPASTQWEIVKKPLPYSSILSMLR